MSNSIWKTPDQKPEPDARRWIYEKPSPIFPYGVSYRHTITAGCLVKAEWAYIDDLIAQADKAERLQKAVDLIANMEQRLCIDDPVDILDDVLKIAKDEIK